MPCETGCALGLAGCPGHGAPGLCVKVAEGDHLYIALARERSTGADGAPRTEPPIVRIGRLVDTCPDRERVEPG